VSSKKNIAKKNLSMKDKNLKNNNKKLSTSTLNRSIFIDKTIKKNITKKSKKIIKIKNPESVLSNDDLLFEQVNIEFDFSRPIKLDSIPKQINSISFSDDDPGNPLDIAIIDDLLDEKNTIDTDLTDIDNVEEIPEYEPSLKDRWKINTNLTSNDYNDKNQILFARRIEITKSIESLKKKKKLSKLEARELEHLASQLDTVTSDLIFFNLGLVNNYSRKFSSSSSSDDGSDFEAAGIVGLMRAVTTYDPSRGTKFSTWAYKPIQREILKAVRDADFKQLNPGDFERRPEILRAVKTLQEGNEEFTPPYEDVAKLANTTIETVKRVLNAPVIDSLNATISEDNDTSLNEVIEDVTAGVEDATISRQDIRDLEAFGLSCLDERELFVIGRRFGLDGEPAQRLSAIGSILGLSREAVRQVEAKALSKLLHPVTRRKLVRHGRK
jgi:RNA polymerase sigma factor (sigma-70 family)